MSHKLTIEEMGRMSVEEFRSCEKLPLTVVLDNVRSLNNVGSVFRTGDAFRVEHVALCGISPESAVGLIVNGYAKDVLKKLPMEFAVEAQKLLSISLEGSVG